MKYALMTSVPVAPVPPLSPRSDPITLMKAVLFGHLAAAGVRSVTITYDGSGDDGQVSDIEARTPDGDVVDLTALRGLSLDAYGQLTTAPTLYASLESFAWDLIETHHEGFEINDGGFGTITMDVPSRVLLLERHDRVITSDALTVEV